MKKLTSAVVASSLVLGLVGTALAAPTADEQQASYARMEALKLVQGTDRGPELDGTLTRAQLLTIIVRAFQYETAAKASMAVGSFSDVPGGQWYSGYVAVAKTLAEERGFAIGYPDGTFKPNNQVTVIEALAMIMKFLGVPVGAGDNWIAQTIENAKAYGVITDADVEKYFADPNAPATRGVAIALADQIFSTYKVAGTDKTVYTYYVDTQAPVISVDPIGTPTVDVAEITLKGKIEGANKAFVTPQGGEQMEITLAADGSFSVVVPLVAGENRIVISATDLAGNYAEYVVPVNRVAGAPAAIKVESTEIELVAGETVELEYAVVDASGLELADAKENVKVTVSEEVGVLNEDGTITVAQKVGQGEIVLSYEGLEDVVLTAKVVPAALDSVALEVDGKRVESAAPSETATLVAVDAYGNKIEGAVFTENEANAVVEGDKFTAFKPGTYTVTVTVGEGEQAVSKDVEVVVYGEAEDLVIEVPKSMVRNNKTEYTVTVKAVDENGALVRDFDEYVEISGDFTEVGDTRVKAKNGVATFKVKVPSNLKEGVIVAETEDFEAELEVETVAQKATAVKLNASKYLGLNSARTLPWTGSVEVVDQEGVRMIDDDDEWDVILELDGPAYFMDNGRKVRKLELTVAGGSATPFEIVSSDNETEGEVVITATADDLKSASATVKTVWAGTPKKLLLTKVSPESSTAIAGNQAIYRIGLADRNDVPVKPTDDVKVTLTFNTDDVTVKYKPADNNGAADSEADFNTGTTLKLKNKKGEITFPRTNNYVYVLVTNEDPSESVTLKVTSTGLTSASVDIEYEAGEPYELKYDKVVTNRAGEKQTVEIQVVDKFGVAVHEVVEIKVKTEASDRIRVNGRRAGSTVTVYTDATGKATIELQPEWNMPSSVTIDLEADLEGRSSLWTGTLTVNRATNDAEELSIEDVQKYITPDAGVGLTINVYDRRGDRMVYDNDPIFDVKVTLKQGTTTVSKTFSVPVPNDKVSPFTINLVDVIKGDSKFYDSTKSELLKGTYVVTVTDNLSIYQPSDSVSFEVVDSTMPAGVKLDGDTDRDGKLDVSAAAWEIKTFTLRVVDAEGTVVTTGQFNVDVSISGDGKISVDGTDFSDTEFTVTPDNTSGDIEFHVMGDTARGNVKFTITVSDGDRELGTVTVTLKK